MNEAEQALQLLKNAIVGIENTIKSRNEELAAIDGRIADTKKSQADVERELVASKAQLNGHLDELKELTEVLTKENERIKSENGALIDRKSELMRANATLERRNTDIINYEKKAIKALEAKDSELVAREAKIQQKESLRGGTKTFLPPASE